MVTTMTEEVAATLRGEIADGTLPVGARFLTTMELMDRFGVAHGTAHKIRRVLADEGLIQACRGKQPTVVAAPDDVVVSVTLEDLADRLSSVELRLTELCRAVAHLAAWARCRVPAGTGDPAAMSHPGPVRGATPDQYPA